LPAEYNSLDADTQGAYRLAVLKTQETEDDFITAFLFFESYYLVGDFEDGYFFDHHIPNAPFHLEGLKDFIRYDLTAIGAPRGFAKSTKWGIQLPMFLLLSRPYYKIAICMSTDNLLAQRFSIIKRHIAENPRIVADFGNLKPVRGEGLWSNHNLEMTNGSTLTGFSVTGRKRGGRPHLFILDDPEYDPERSTDTRGLAYQLEQTIVKQVIPMLRPGCKLFWLGTTINRRAFLYHVLTSDDPRFSLWNRRRFKSYSQDPDGTTHLLWKEMFTFDQLMQRKMEIGTSAFAAEYQNEPVPEEARLFHVHETYDTYDVDGDLLPTPWDSTVPIRYLQLPRRFNPESASGVERVELPFHEFMKKLSYVMMTVDYASTVHLTSDYSAMAIVGFTPDGTMWVLDLWTGKMTDEALVKQAWAMGSRWHPKCVASESQSFLDLLRYRIDDMLLVTGETNWRPRPFLLKYGGRSAPSKAQRIKGEEWRFTAHRIKLPLSKRHQAHWTMLFDQIEDFTEDLNMLEHDDAIDCVLGMPRFVMHIRPQTGDAGKPRGPADYLAEGKLTDDCGMPLYADINEAPDEHVQRALDILKGRADNTGGRRFRRQSARIVRRPR